MCPKRESNKILTVACVLWFCSFSASAVLAQTKVSLSHYTIPVDVRGVHIGSVLSLSATKEAKIKMIRDTANLFVVRKNGEISLRKNKLLQAKKGAHAYEIVLRIDGKPYAFELVKDEFLRNKVIAHRGAWRSQGVMQNSIRSFQHAVELGCAGSEFDVWLSGDKQVVLSHDPHIGGLSVEESTAEALHASTLKGGDPVPTLVDFIRLAKQQNQTKMILEIKPSPTGRSMELADSVVNIVHRLKAQGYLEYISFDYAVLKRIVHLDPSARTAYLYGNKTVEELKADSITGLDYDFYHYRNMPNLPTSAKAAGLATNVWTVNSEEELRKFLDSEVDWITTDEPELLLKLIKQQPTTSNYE